MCHLLNKKHEVEDFIRSQNIDIMILAETFLSCSTADSLLSIPNHALFRRDRPSHGGGLAAYVHNRSQAQVVGDHTNIELLLLEIRSHRNRILLGGVYRPPGTPVQFWQDLSNAVDTAAASMPSSPLILTGDFNVDVSRRQAPQLDNLHRFCDQFNISNKVQDTTRIAPHGSRTTLDLALAVDGAITSCTVLPCTISDHFAVVIDLPFKCTVEPPAVKCGRNLARIDMNRFAHVTWRIFQPLRPWMPCGILGLTRLFPFWTSTLLSERIGLNFPPARPVLGNYLPSTTLFYFATQHIVAGEPRRLTWICELYSHQHEPRLSECPDASGPSITRIFSHGVRQMRASLGRQ